MAGWPVTSGMSSLTDASSPTAIAVYVLTQASTCHGWRSVAGARRVGLLDGLVHVGHVPVADVGAEDRAHPAAEGQDAAVEAEGVDRVVGLAAEPEVALEDRAHVTRGGSRS